MEDMCLVAQLCLTLCNPWTAAHQGPLSTGIHQTRILERVAMPSSRGSSQPKDQTQVSRIAGSLYCEPQGKSKALEDQRIILS